MTKNFTIFEGTSEIQRMRRWVRAVACGGRGRRVGPGLTRHVEIQVTQRVLRIGQRRIGRASVGGPGPADRTGAGEQIIEGVSGTLSPDLMNQLVTASLSVIATVTWRRREGRSNPRQAKRSTRYQAKPADPASTRNSGDRSPSSSSRSPLPSHN